MTTESLHYLPSMLRTLAVVPVSAFVTLALLFCMFMLIKNDQEFIEEPEPTPQIARIAMPRQGPIETLFERPERPVEPDLAPVTPPTEITFEPPVVGVIPVERFKPPVISGNPMLGSGDQPMPFIRVQPNYPPRAAERGIEGFVDVAFDVTATGATENIRVLHAEPSTIFNSSVIKAIKGWKYKPRMVDGAATKTYDLRERITFRLDN